MHGVLLRTPSSLDDAWKRRVAAAVLSSLTDARCQRSVCLTAHLFHFLSMISSVNVLLECSDSVVTLGDLKDIRTLFPRGSLWEWIKEEAKGALANAGLPGEWLSRWGGGANANAHCPTLRLDLAVTSGATSGWMAWGSHSFTCHPHVYPRMERAILHAFRKHSPDGVTQERWRTSGSAYYSSIDPERMKGWVGLVGWPHSGWFTHISGHPSATGRAWDREFAGHRPTFYHWAT